MYLTLGATCVCTSTTCSRHQGVLDQEHHQQYDNLVGQADVQSALLDVNAFPWSWHMHFCMAGSLTWARA